MSNKLCIGEGVEIPFYTSMFHIPENLDRLYVALCKDEKDQQGKIKDVFYNHALEISMLASTAGMLTVDNGKRNVSKKFEPENVGILCKRKKTDTTQFIYNLIDKGDTEVVVLYDETGELDDMAQIKSNELYRGNGFPNCENKLALPVRCSAPIFHLSETRKVEVSAHASELWCVPVMVIFGTNTSREFASDCIYGISGGALDVDFSDKDWDSARQWLETPRNGLTDSNGLKLNCCFTLCRDKMAAEGQNLKKKMSLLDEMETVIDIWNYSCKNAGVPFSFDCNKRADRNGIAGIAKHLGVESMYDAWKSGVPMSDIMA